MSFATTGEGDEHLRYQMTEALIKLYMAYADDLYDYAYYRIKDAAAAEDLVQTVFLLACQKIEHIAPECRQAWLYAVMRNLIRTYRRRRARHPEISLEDKNVRPILIQEAGLEDEAGLRFPHGLKPDFCEILRLRIVEKKDYDEIAKVLGIREVSARQRFSRAMKAYQKLTQREKN